MKTCFNFLLTLIIGTLITGCETITPAQGSSGMAQSLMEEFGEKKNFGIVVFNSKMDDSFDDWESCNSFELTMVNLDKFDVVKLTSSHDPMFGTSYPTSLPVVPGTYALLNGKCTVYGYTGGELESIKYWFEPFEVIAGEFTYMGTLNLKTVDVKSRLNLGQALMAFSTEKEHRFSAFTFEDYYEDAVSRLKVNYPRANIQLKKRFPKALIEPDVFEEMVFESYKLDELGKMPTKKIARERLLTRISSYLKERRVYDKSIGRMKKVLEEYREALDAKKAENTE